MLTRPQSAHVGRLVDKVTKVQYLPALGGTCSHPRVLPELQWCGHRGTTAMIHVLVLHTYLLQPTMLPAHDDEQLSRMVPVYKGPGRTSGTLRVF